MINHKKRDKTSHINVSKQFNCGKYILDKNAIHSSKKFLKL